MIISSASQRMEMRITGIWNQRCTWLITPLLLFVLAISSATQTAISQVKGTASGSEPSSLVREAATLLEQGQLDAAEATARRAVAIQPRNTAARSVLGAILDKRGMAKEAEQEYRHALRLDPNSTNALTNLGVLLVRTNRGDQAITTFERVLKLAPGHEYATYNLATLYSARKEFARTIQLLEPALCHNKNTSKPKDLGLMLTLANAYAHVNRAQDASKLFDEIENQAGSDARVLFTLALSAADAGAYERAC